MARKSLVVVENQAALIKVNWFKRIGLQLAVLSMCYKSRFLIASDLLSVVSVLIPCRNAGQFLRAVVQSVMA